MLQVMCNTEETLLAPAHESETNKSSPEHQELPEHRKATFGAQQQNRWTRKTCLQLGEEVEEANSVKLLRNAKTIEPVTCLPVLDEGRKTSTSMG